MSSAEERDSMERFGDDLAQVLLSWLPLELKISLECVSKQWRRVVFAGDHRFELLRHRLRCERWSPLFVRSYVHQIQTFELNARLLRSLLQKFDHLSELLIDPNCKCDEHVLDVMSELYDSHTLSSLKWLDIRIRSDVSYDVLHRFCRLFGQTLRYVSIAGLSSDRLATVLPFFGPNLRAIDLKHNLRSLVMCCADTTATVDDMTPFLPKLDNISAANPSPDDLEVLTRVYGKQLKQLSLSFDQHFKHSIKNALKLVANVPNLQLLRLDSELFFIKQNDFNDSQLIDTSLALIGHKCPHLRSLEICIFGDLISDDFLKIFGRHFERLERLDLSLWDIGDKHFQSVNSLGFNAHNGQHLRQLNLMFEVLSDDHLQHIHQLMPNLTAVKLNSDQLLTDECLRHLCQLSRLRTIVLEGNIDLNVLTVEGIVELMARCPTVRLIDIEFANDLNEVSYEAFKVLAEMRPQINFHISFHDSDDRYRDVCVYVNTKNNLHVYKI